MIKRKKGGGNNGTTGAITKESEEIQIRVERVRGLKECMAKENIISAVIHV